MVALLVGIVSAIDFPVATNQYVNDFDGVLNQVQKQELIGLFYGVEQNTTAEIVFVSVSDLKGYDISQYATELGQKWGVGKSDKDNGLVILYASDVGKIYVATGYGLEGILPDSKIGRILDENYVPLRDSGNFSDGIVLASEVFAQEIFDNADEVRSGKAGGQTTSFASLVVLIFIGMIFVALFIFFASGINRKKRGFGGFWNFFFADFLARMVLASILGGNRSSGSSGGFGGGGFGGGGFGGGGAGR